MGELHSMEFQAWSVYVNDLVHFGHLTHDRTAPSAQNKHHLSEPIYTVYLWRHSRVKFRMLPEKMAMAQSNLPKFHRPKTRQNPSSHWEAHSAYWRPVAFLPELNGVHLPKWLPNKLKQSGGKLPTCWGLLVTSWENRWPTVCTGPFTSGFGDGGYSGTWGFRGGYSYREPHWLV